MKKGKLKALKLKKIKVQKLNKKTLTYEKNIFKSLFKLLVHNHFSNKYHLFTFFTITRVTDYVNFF